MNMNQANASQRLLPGLLLLLAAAVLPAARAYPADTLPQCFTPGELEALGLPPPAEAHRGASIAVEVNDWDSQNLASNTVGYILKEAMGYEVTFPFTSGEDGSWVRASEGLIDCNVEVWATVYRDSFDEYTKDRGTAIDAGVLGADGANGLYIPGFATRGAYESRLYDYWRAYREPSALADFPLYPSVDPSLYVEGEAPFIPPQCVNASCIELLGLFQVADQGTVQQVIVNLNLPIVMVFAGIEGALGSVQAYVDAAQPTIFFGWVPSAFIASGDYVRVELPQATSACYRDNTRSLDGVGTVDCDMANQQLLKVARAGLLDEAAKIDAHNTIRAFTLTDDDENFMMQAIAQPGATHEAVACAWLRNHTDKWTPFVYNHGVSDTRVSEAMQAAFVALAAVSAAVILGFLGVMTAHRTAPVVRASSYPLMMVIGASCAVGTASIPLAAEPDDARCVAQNWLFSLSLIVTLTTLILKAWRVTRIFLSKNLGRGRLRLTDGYLLRLVAAVAAVEVGLLVADLASGEAGARVRLEKGASVNINGRLPASELQPVERVTTCADNESLYGVLSLVYKALIMVAGVFVSFTSRQLPAGFSEAKSVAVTLYNLIIGAMLFLPLVFTTDDVNVEFAARSSFVLWSTLLTAVTVFGPRTYYLFAGAPEGYLNTGAASGTATANSNVASTTKRAAGGHQRKYSGVGATSSRTGGRAPASRSVSPGGQKGSPRASRLEMQQPSPVATSRVPLGAGAGPAEPSSGGNPPAARTAAAEV